MFAKEIRKITRLSALVAIALLVIAATALAAPPIAGPDGIVFSLDRKSVV